jgi:hypothetical protein
MAELLRSGQWGDRVKQELESQRGFRDTHPVTSPPATQPPPGGSTTFHSAMGPGGGSSKSVMALCDLNLYPEQVMTPFHVLVPIGASSHICWTFLWGFCFCLAVVEWNPGFCTL